MAELRAVSCESFTLLHELPWPASVAIAQELFDQTDRKRVYKGKQNSLNTFSSVSYYNIINHVLDSWRRSSQHHCGL